MTHDSPTTDDQLSAAAEGDGAPAPDPLQALRSQEKSALAAMRFEGRSGAGRHIVGAVFILLLWVLLNVVMVLVVTALGFQDAVYLMGDGVNWIDLDPAQDVDARVVCAMVLISPALLIPSVWIVTRLLLGRSLKSTFTAAPKFRWGLALTSVATFLIASFSVSMIFEVFVSSDLQQIYDPARFWPFVPIIVLLTPLQIFGEEVFVRGYLFQTVSTFTKAYIIRLVLPSVVFASLHLANQDMAMGGLWALGLYFGIGAYLAFITIRTDGVEHASAIHLINNLSAFLLVSSAGTGMPFPAIYYDPAPDYSVGFVAMILVLLVHYLLTFKVLPRLGRKVI